MVELLALAVMVVSSQITDVTVYNDRAQVVRTAEVELKPEMTTLRFEDLPPAVDSRGIQVDGAGAATVIDVRYQVENYEDVPQETWKALYEQETALKQEQTLIHQKVDAYRKAKAFLASIRTKVTSTHQEEGDPELNPESWKRMLDMQLARQMAYDEEIRKAEKEQRELQNKIRKVQADLHRLGAGKNRQRRNVEVDVETKTAGKATFRLSYLVRGPGWTPTYDVRVDTESRRIELKYYALVRQNTGEDWGDVAVKLSTAHPGLGGQHPELQPWRIKTAPHIQVVEVHRYASDYTVERGQRTVPVVKPADWNDLDLGDALKVRGASANDQGTAVVFDIKGRSTVASDNTEHRVAIGTSNLPAHFRYSTVPMVDATAYLKARSTNSGSYPFLAGKANIFLDGSYVTASTLDFVPPGEDFWVFLGVDQGMKVEHKLLKRVESNEGLRGHKVRYTYEYLLVVKNTHDKPEEFIIWDRLPMSENEEIKVKLLEPKYSKDTEALTLDDSKRLQWFHTLTAGEEVQIPFSFYIEVPKGLMVEGL